MNLPSVSLIVIHYVTSLRNPCQVTFIADTATVHELVGSELKPCPRDTWKDVISGHTDTQVMACFGPTIMFVYTLLAPSFSRRRWQNTRKLL